MRCTIELTSEAALLLVTPTGREIQLQPIPAAIALLQRILYHAEENAQAPMSYPTQHVIDAWNRGKAIDWSRPEPTVKRTVIGDAPSGRKKTKPTLKAFGHERKLDLDKIDFLL